MRRIDFTEEEAELLEKMLRSVLDEGKPCYLHRGATVVRVAPGIIEKLRAPLECRTRPAKRSELR